MKVGEGVVKGKSPFPRAVIYSGVLMAWRRPDLPLLEHTVGVLIAAGKNKLPCANVGRDILVLL